MSRSFDILTFQLDFQQDMTRVKKLDCEVGHIHQISTNDVGMWVLCK